MTQLDDRLLPVDDEHDDADAAHDRAEAVADRADDHAPAPHPRNVAPCGCDGHGQVHHGHGPLSYVTLCRDRDCEIRRDAAFMGVSREDIAAYLTSPCEHAEQAARLDGATGGDSATGSCGPPAAVELSQFPHTGAAALTTVEARGTTASPESSAVSVTEGLGGRAAGAQLTGQRQDGPSQGPARRQHPTVAHGDRGSNRAGVNGEAHDALKDGDPRADPRAPLCALSPEPSCVEPAAIPSEGGASGGPGASDLASGRHTFDPSLT